MPSPTYYSILTTVGLAKIADAIANSTPINITEMALGDGNGSTPTPSAGQTSLVHQVYREPLAQLITDPDNPAYAIAELIVPAEDGPFTVREMGLYDDDNDLIAVGNFPTTYKPVASEGSVRDLVIRMIIDVENATAVTLTIDPAVVLASQEYVDNPPHDIKQANGKYISTDKVRARDGDGLHLQDDGGNGIFIEDGGNVGVGTTTPQSDFHVKGSTRVSRTTSDSNYVETTAENGNAEHNAVNMNHVWKRDGSEVMRIDSTGLGIGTSSPTQKLHVNGNIRTAVGGTVYTDNLTGMNLDLTIGTAGGGDKILFKTGATERMRIAGGNIGIGRTDPAYPLSPRNTTTSTAGPTDVAHVSALSTGTPNSSFGSRLLFEAQAPNTNSYDVAGIAGLNSAAGSNCGDLALYARNSGTLTEFLRILSTGKVGIGTSTPGYKLDVVDPTSSSSTNAGINIVHTLNARLRFVTTTQNVRYYIGLSDTSAALEFRDDNGVLRLLLAQGGDLRPGVDDAQDIGHSSLRWDDVYATNGTIQTSDERLKTAIEDCPLGLDFIKALRAVSYKWADREAQTATRMVQKTQIVQREVEQREVIEIDGKYVLSVTTVTKEIEEPIFEEKPLYDEDGNLVYKSIQKTEPVQKEYKDIEVVEIDGKFVRQEVTVTMEVIEPVFETHELYDSDNNPVLDEEGNPVLYQIPVMETVQVFHQVPVMEEQEYEVGIAKSFSRRHFGLIAQEVLQVLQDQEIDTADFAPLTYDEEADRYGMRYAELVGILIKAIQELTARVEVLES